jgi:predicted AlkP superfamily pyrophosphatase or phosphodiesterase
MLLSRFRRSAGLAIIFALISAASAQQRSTLSSADDFKPTLLFISIDGFRADYLDTVPAPILRRLAKEGASGGMYPVFPSLTFPNHYSIVTGLYPAEHGIVSNVFRDPKYPGVTFKSSEDAVKQESRWWLGEPIWVTAEKQHQHAAILYWPGSDAEIDGIRPTHWEHYKKRPVPEESVAELLSWFDAPASERPTVFGLYFEDVDHAGHDFGPSSQELKDAVAGVDRAIGKLLDGLAERKMADKVNIIIVSDHGMSQLSRERLDVLEDYVDLAKIDITYNGPVFSFYLRDPNDKPTLAKMGAIPHAKLYTLATAPKRFHYSGSDRLTPYFLLMDDGWSITDRKYLEGHPKFATGGAHGYDPKLPSMRALFIAHGPAFKAGVQFKPFANINLYSLFAHLQGLSPAKNEGKWEIFRPVLTGQVRKAAAAVH